MLLFAILLSYVIGSIPFGLIAGKLRGVDVRDVGSGNIGTTNVWRTLGPVAGTVVFALDVGKGLVGPNLARLMLPGNEAAVAWCAVAAVLGHIFSIFLGGRGGKGIATALGAIFGLAPLVGLGAFGLWGVMLALTRFISVASMAACFAVLVGAWTTGTPVSHAVVISVMAVLALVKHIPNMKRLVAGTEPRIGPAKAPSSSESAAVAQSTLEV